MSDPLQPRKHSNNTTPPDDNSDVRLRLPGGETRMLGLADLQQDYPPTRFFYSYTTDHGDHGPYLLEGVTLKDLLAKVPAWSQVEVISADGFGNRVFRSELNAGDNPVMLYYRSDGELLTRQNGLLRLVVPSETDNALRQVKWVRELKVD